MSKIKLSDSLIAANATKCLYKLNSLILEIVILHILKLLKFN